MSRGFCIVSDIYFSYRQHHFHLCYHFRHLSSFRHCYLHHHPILNRHRRRLRRYRCFSRQNPHHRFLLSVNLFIFGMTSFRLAVLTLCSGYISPACAIACNFLSWSWKVIDSLTSSTRLLTGALCSRNVVERFLIKWLGRCLWWWCWRLHIAKSWNVWNIAHRKNKDTKSLI